MVKVYFKDHKIAVQQLTFCDQLNQNTKNASHHLHEKLEEFELDKNQKKKLT